MDCDVDVNPAVTFGQALRSGGWLTWAMERIGRRGAEQWNRELDIRQEERERERARIARELHDSLLQGFLGASLQVHAALNQLPDDSPARTTLSRAADLTQRALEEARFVMHAVRVNGGVSMNLEQALSAVHNEFALFAGAQFRISVKGKHGEIDPFVHEEVYLISREALVNALRHARATNIEVEIEYLPNRVCVVIRDNGGGIDPEVLRSGRPAHWGLIGMRERAVSIGAEFQIRSQPKAGTEVEISLATC